MPYGLMATVRAGFRRLGLYDYLDGFKEKGVPLSYAIELMCIHQLDGGSSMNKCGSLSDSPLVKDELCHGYTISRKTIERSLGLLDQYFEDILGFIWGRLNDLYAFINTDVYVDGSHVERYGPKGAYTAAGEGGGTIQLQDQFMVAQLKDSGLPIMIEVYDGNLNDPPQYDDFIPQLMHLLKEGSMIIMDNGGSNKELLDEIRDGNMDYLTRVRMNASDEKRMNTEQDRMMYIGRGTACLMQEFESSEKTNYLFFSVDRYILGSLAAERRAKKLAQELAYAREVHSNPSIGKLVSFKRNPFYRVTINSFTVEMTLDPWLDTDILKAAGIETGERCGWFKLQCSRRLPPREALDLYRHRVQVEHLISSIKSVVNLKPLRVWSKESVRGSVLMAMIAQLQISMVRYELEPDVVEKWEDGKRVKIPRKPSEKTIIENLSHWTVTVFSRDGWNLERVFSNETELTRRISRILDGF